MADIRIMTTKAIAAMFRLNIICRRNIMSCITRYSDCTSSGLRMQGTTELGNSCISSKLKLEKVHSRGNSSILADREK